MKNLIDNGAVLAIGVAGIVAAAGAAIGRKGSRYRQEEEVLQIKSTTGQPYNLRVVQPGGKYGAKRALTNSGPAMLEFYWVNTKNPSEPFWDSYFTGERYSLSTLVRSCGRGLRLQNEDASFDAKTMQDALVWALKGNPASMYG